MLSRSDNNQTDIIEAFNSTSRYLNGLLIIDNFYFEQMVGQIPYIEFQLKMRILLKLVHNEWHSQYTFLYLTTLLYFVRQILTNTCMIQDRLSYGVFLQI